MAEVLDRAVYTRYCVNMKNIRGQIQGFVVGAVVAATMMIGGQALAAPGYPAAPLTNPDDIATAFGVNLVWDTSDCNTTARPGVTYGCTSSDQPNTVRVRAGMDADREHYVLLHEIGHVIQFRLGIDTYERGADNLADAMGGGTGGFYCHK